MRPIKLWKGGRIETVEKEGREASRSKERFGSIAHKRRVTALYNEYKKSPSQFSMTFEEFKRQTGCGIIV